MARDGDGEPEVSVDGTVDRVVFHAEDTSFTVARLVTAGHEQVTIVGALFDIKEGMPLRLTGQWIVDKKWGKQFKVASYRLTTPATLVGIERFLGSSAFRGIGPELAKRLVKQFGMATLDVIEKTPDRLTEVSGIGASRAAVGGCPQRSTNGRHRRAMRPVRKILPRLLGGRIMAPTGLFVRHG